jgi:hypothetical protein
MDDLIIDKNNDEILKSEELLKDFFIDLKEFDRDFNSIQKFVGINFMSENIKNKLSNELSNEIDRVIVEKPYIDKDFRSTFYKDFSKRFSNIERNSVRLHFFNTNISKTIINECHKDGYLGFITLRDTMPYTIGRSYLNPKALLNNSKNVNTKDYCGNYYLLTEYKVNILGKEYCIKAFPWMQQDANISRCAHVAMWEIIRYYSEKYKLYGEYLLQEIFNLTESYQREIPSKGMTVENISYGFKKIGFAPEVYFRDNKEEGIKGLKNDYFEELIYIFIESGIPFIAASFQKAHAISIIGHCNIVKDKTSTINKKIISASELVDGYLSGNDHFLPYSFIDKSEINNKSIESIKDIEGIIIPLYQKMYFNVVELLNDAIPKIEKKFIDINENNQDKFIRRIFITSSKSFKKKVLENSSDKKYKDYITRSSMPRFIWVVEYSKVNDYPKQVSYRFLFDTTSLQFYKLDNILLSWKAKKEIFFYHNAMPYKKDLQNDLEPIYINNLENI